MVIDVHGMSHKAKGLPDGGRYDGRQGVGGDTDLEAATLLTVASLGLRDHAMIDRTTTKTPAETKGLLQDAKHVNITPEGVELYDDNDELIFRETNLTPGLDTATLRADPRVRRSVRTTLQDDLAGMPAADRRKTMHAAWRLATPYSRRKAIDTSPNRRYIPAASIANSLSRRKDRDQAIDILTQLHYEDANASANVIRNGYPDDKQSAMTFINRTKIQRYGKDVTDRTGAVIHRKGEAIVGDYTARDGTTRHGPLPASKGSAARSYLRMLYQPTKGVPDQRDTDDMTRALHDIGVREGSKAQAEAFWRLCYGDGTPRNPHGSTMIAQQVAEPRTRTEHGRRLLQQLSHDKGQGNAARMVAYRKPLSRNAAIRFLRMKPGDDRKANTLNTRRVRNPQTGRMEDVTPKRLTEMRSWIRSVYQIGDRDIREWENQHPDE